jgi:hypothetical protein
LIQIIVIIVYFVGATCLDWTHIVSPSNEKQEYHFYLLRMDYPEDLSSLGTSWIYTVAKECQDGQAD